MNLALRRLSTGVLWLVLLACSSDDGAATESGPSSVREPAQPPLTHVTAKVGSGDPAAPCDRFAAAGCAAGSRCALAIRREPGAVAFDVYATCDAAEAGIAQDQPCVPWGGLTQRTPVAGSSAELYLDPCAAGLQCTNSPQERATYRCRPSCDLDGQVLCARGEFCYSGPSALESACLASDHCDPSLREGCADGVGCYLRPNDSASGLLTECLPIVREPPLPDLAPCESTLDCQPGSWCWGPSTRKPGDWSKSEQYCRRACDASYPDAEVCDPDMICRELTVARTLLDFSEVPIPLGQCEQH